VKTGQRTLGLLRRLGWRAESVERFIPQIKRRRDLFRFVDVLAYRVNPPVTLAVQAYGRERAAHLERLFSDDRVREAMFDWVRGRPARYLVLVGWIKGGPRGRRKLWIPRIEVVLPGGPAESGMAATEVPGELKEVLHG
jgi:hypothetical protein